MSEKEYCITMPDVFSARERIKDVAVYTPLTGSESIREITKAKIQFKLETMQRCKAFKFRGALNKLKTLPENSTVVCVSAGNHSQGVALSAKLCNCNSVVYMPKNAASAKVSATQEYGATVVQVGANFDEAKAEMEKHLSEHPEWIFVPPFNDPYIIAGQATVALEILEQDPHVETIVVPIGGGGLISGVAYVVKHVKPSVRVVGVNMASCPSTFKEFNSNKGLSTECITKETLTPLADGIAVKQPGPLNMNIINDFVDEVVVVNEDMVVEAIALMVERAKIISEGAGATPLAAVLHKRFKYKENENIVCIVSGGNIPLRMLSRCIDRALFLRKVRVSVSIIVPYGTSYLVDLMKILVDHNAEVVSCNSAAHVDTYANKEQYVLIIDVPSDETLNDIQKECENRKWVFEHQLTEAMD